MTTTTVTGAMIVLSEVLELEFVGSTEDELVGVAVGGVEGVPEGELACIEVPVHVLVATYDAYKIKNCAS